MVIIMKLRLLPLLLLVSFGIIEFANPMQRNAATSLSTAHTEFAPLAKLPEENPLHTAASAGNLDEVKRLLATPGIDVNAPDEEDLTALHFAVIYGHTRIVEELLTAEFIDINAADKKGWTALHLAAENGLRDIVQILLTTEDIDVNSTNEDGQTALELAYSEDIRIILRNKITLQAMRLR